MPKIPSRKSSAIAVLGIITVASVALNVYLLFPRDSVQEVAPPARATMILQKFKVSGNNPNFDAYFLVIGAGKDRNIWANNGLDPEFVYPDTPRGLSAADIKQLAASGIGLGIAVPSEVLLARSSGAPVKLITGVSGLALLNKVYVRADSPIKTVKELDGKKIGVVSLVHNTFRTALYLANKSGITVEAVPVGNITNRIVALKLGKVDAIAGVEADPLRLVDSAELRILVNMSDIRPKPDVGVGFWATEDLIEKDPELVRRFVKAILDTVKYLKENPGYQADLYVKVTNAPRDIAERAVYQRDWQPSGRGSGSDLVQAVVNNWQWNKESGAIPANVNVKIEDAIDVRFLP